MKPLIIANWKMNPQTLDEAKELFSAVEKGIGENKNTEIVICPPFVFLKEPSSFRRSSAPLSMGAQDVFWEQKGAFTGEISPEMLKDVGCQYVIIGHSERRRIFKETDEMINKKLKAVLEVGLNPILCVGETQGERSAGKTNEILKSQLSKDLKEIHNPVIIAYEPVWAIGTGNACEVEDAKKARMFIEKNIPENTRIIYGGSVKSANAASYIKEAGFKGLLVGGASLDIKEFIGIVKAAI